MTAILVTGLSVLAGTAAAAPPTEAISTPPHSSGAFTWQIQNTPASNVTLTGVACSSTSACIAVGTGGTIDSTADGGATWTIAASGTVSDLAGAACVTGGDCVAVGAAGTIVSSLDGGRTWLSDAAGTSAGLNGVACSSATACWAVGDGGVIISGSATGRTWHTVADETVNLYAVSCPSGTSCTAVGFQGTVVATSDGTTWSPQSSGTPSTLFSVSCATVAACRAVGPGAVVSTADGVTWTSGSVPAPSGSSLQGIACTAPSTCRVTGINPGTVATTTDGGSTWSTEMPDTANWLFSISCPDSSHCWAVGTGGLVMAGTHGSTTISTTAPVFDADAPDPDVLSSGGTFYAFTTGTKQGNYLQLLASPDLASWTVLGSALPQPPGWEAVNTQEAPGVFFWGGQYVLYYAAVQSSTGTRCLSMATSPTVTGPFLDASTGPLLCDASLGGVLDPQPFVDPSGRAYLDWKSNDGLPGINSQIWSAPIGASGVPDTSAKVSLVLQDQPNTVEAPFMVNVSGADYLFYSIGLWNSSNYGVGYAQCASPTGPCTTVQSATVLSSTSNALGPGGESVVTDSSGALWMAYAAWNGPSSSFSYAAGDFRSLWLTPLTFSGGVPVAGGGSGGGSTSCTSSTTPATTGAHSGYWLASSVGAVYGCGRSPYGSAPSGVTGVVSIASTSDQLGYWLAGADGNVYPFGDASSFGSMAGRALARPVVALTGTGDAKGYWLVASDGGLFAFGDAGFFGSMGGKPLNDPIVGILATGDGRGYWMVASDGGLFAFGDAGFFGSMGGKPLNRPIVAMAASPDGKGYWMVASDGGIFAFGDAGFFGSMGGTATAGPVIGMAS